jgi:hypothetical protein
MSLLKTVGGALIATLLCASPAMAQIRVGGPMIRVRMAPPAPIVERIPLAPSSRHIWTGGHWQWDAMQSRHIWSPGYYQIPPQGQYWVAAHWANRGGEYIYEPGHWSAGVQPVYAQPVYQPPPQPVYQPPPQPVYQPPVQEVYQQPVQDPYQQVQPVDVQIETAPPPPQVEVIPVAPSPNHFWIGGYWGWRGGQHYWNPGRYELRRPGMTWQSPAWGRNGRYWRYSPGGWRR